MRDQPASVTMPEEFEDLFENAPCGYLLLDADGRIKKSNKTLAIWLCIAPETLSGKRFSDLLNMPGRIVLETHFLPLLRSQGHLHEVALDIKKEDNTLLPVLVNASERHNEQGALLSTRVVIFQAKERRKWERALVEAKLAANAAEKSAKTDLDHERQSSELREQFIAVLGHDLRNPLASMVAAANLLTKEEQSPKSLRIIEMMRGSIHRMSGLIDNVMDFARGRLGGGISLMLSDHDSLEVMLKQVVEELLVGHPGRTIEIDIRIGNPVFCDPGRIGQLVSNLLGNAILHGSADKPIILTARTEANRLDLWVANSGPQIPDAKLEKLFQPFFRGDAHDNRTGLGLGLHIAAEIARAHSGTLTVSSSEQQTRFTLSMPAVANKQEAAD